MDIRIEDLHKSFGDRQILRGVNLEIPTGQLCVIVGGSGTGKSVLLKHLVGVLKPDSGKIYIDNQEITGLSESQLMPIRRRFGMIFQGGGLLQSITVGQNVGLVLEEVHHMKESEIRKIVAEKLAAVGLEGREDQFPSTLSGGQRKRAAIARALVCKADCFLFDEPTAGLDPPMAGNVDEVIAEVNKETKATTIVVTHDMVSVFALADMVHMLHEGVVIASGTPDELKDMDHPRVQEFLAREVRA